MDEENIKTMKKTGVMICLSASPEVIIKRTSGYAHRPLLNVSGPKKQISHLLKLRAPYYAQADKSINTSKLSIKQAADRIAKLVSNKKNKN
jgi:shikimate kinase